MRLTRAQSIVIAVGVLLLFFGAVAVLVQNDRRPVLRPLELEQNSSGERSGRAAPDSHLGVVESPSGGNRGTEAPPATTAWAVPDLSASSSGSAGSEGTNPLQGNSPFTLHRFERSEVRDGKKVWEVKAAEGQYFPEESKAVVKQAELFVYSKTGDRVQLWANQGTLFLRGPSLEKAEVEGKVRVVQNDDVVITTERALYDQSKNLVEVPGVVHIESPTFEVSGNSMSIDLESRSAILRSDVETVIKPGHGAALPWSAPKEKLK